jgi:4-hydroxy-3-methylbut-2-enyl diphosphate reductase IspH
VGLTAGTSTPDAVIQEIESWLLARHAFTETAPAK